jgi:hypothetical protein
MPVFAEQRGLYLAMAIHSTGVGDDEVFVGPLAVSPKKAGVMLDLGQTSIYALIKNGELETYQEGRARKITMRSIRARIERKIAESAASPERPSAN